jgi:predicted RND superfamily exporter protein
MSRGPDDGSALVERFNRAVLSRPVAVVAAFLLVTALFAGGVPLVSTGDEGTEAFTEDVPAFRAQEQINERFGDRFAGEDGSSQLIHAGGNVLAREALARNLRLLERAQERDDLRIAGAAGPAPLIARAIDPEARTITQQRRTIEGATDRQIRRAVRELAAEPRFRSGLSEDFNPEAASASASVTVVSHEFPADSGDGFRSAQVRFRSLADDEPGDFRVFGGGIIDAEFGNIIGDSLTIVIPVVLFLMLAFLVVAYRDPIDLVLGLVALLLTVVWTFGFIGYAGIPIDQQQIAVPVLLLAVGIDFGIHIVNRYREELGDGVSRRAAMTAANRQLVVAFLIVTVTTVFGFGANLISDLGPTRRFGLSSAVGIVFTFLIFGLFLPAAKLLADRWRDRAGIPAFNSAPIAAEESALGRALSVGATVTRHAPVLFVIAFLVVGGAAGVYAEDVDRTFDTDDFLPPEELPGYVTGLPEPFAPGEYTVTRDLNFLEENFAAAQGDSVVLYVEGPFESDHALESVARANRNPPDSFVTTGGTAEAESIITVIRSYAQRDPEFAALVARNDRNDNGIPDRNLDRIYDALLASPAAGQADQYLTDDRRSLRIVYSVEGDASQGEVAADARAFSDEFRQETTATGQLVVFDAIASVIFETAIRSLVLAIGTVAAFLVVVYGVIARRPVLGVVNLLPILITVALLVATMRRIGISLNALTATLLSITIGVGIAYSVHVTHRFIDEYRDDGDAYRSLTTTLTGTGGALTGSMLTTSIGTGALVLAITPILGTFGLLMAISVFYSYLTAIVVLPPILLVWADYVDGRLEPVGAA